MTLQGKTIAILIAPGERRSRSSQSPATRCSRPARR